MKKLLGTALIGLVINAVDAVPMKEPYNVPYTQKIVNILEKPNNQFDLQESQKEQIRLVEKAFYNSFNNTSMTADEIAKEYFSPKFKFYAGDTGKIIDYNGWIGRVNAVRKNFQSVDVIYENFVFSTTGGNSLGETHYIFGRKFNGDTVIIKTNNIINFDKEGKIKTLYNVEQVIKGGAAQATHDAYMIH